MDNNGTLDLSKVISLITENPKLIAEISALAKSSQSDENEGSAPKESTEEISKPSEVIETSGEPGPSFKAEPKNRQRLLSAFKPYLSNERAKAIDSMLSIADILDSIKGR